jgi:hypothetical protein
MRTRKPKRLDREGINVKKHLICQFRDSYAQAMKDICYRSNIDGRSTAHPAHRNLFYIVVVQSVIGFSRPVCEGNRGVRDPRRTAHVHFFEL